MKSHNKKIILAVAGIVVVILAVFAIDQFFVLQKAHSTFDNYYAFRGCVQLLSRTDTSGVCKTVSGDTITIVLINGKWYLQGDGPGVW
jgi:hypothetical protein